MRINNFKYFYPEKPTLISVKNMLFSSMSSSSKWIAEKKYNENRLLLHYINKEFQFWSRHGELISYTPTSNLLESLNKLPLKGYCVFDGGLRHNKVVGIKNKIIIYDVLVWNNKLLLGKAFKERRLILESFLECEGDSIGIPLQYGSEFKDVFNKVTKDDEIEGIVIKNLNGILNLGRNSASNSKWMLKIRKPCGRYRF